MYSKSVEQGNLKFYGVSRPYDVKTIKVNGSLEININIDGNYYKMSAEDEDGTYNDISGFMPDQQNIRMYLDADDLSEEEMSVTVKNDSDTMLFITLLGDSRKVKIFDRNGNSVLNKNDSENLYIY